MAQTTLSRDICIEVETNLYFSFFFLIIMVIYQLSHFIQKSFCFFPFVIWNLSTASFNQNNT